MYSPRKIETSSWLDSDEVKIYTISSNGKSFDQEIYIRRLQEVKKARNMIWKNTPSFCIFHNGAQYPYLILAWWANDNELFTSVSVCEKTGWQEDPKKYSFCVYDLEIFWAERNFFIETIDCQNPDVQKYRNLRYSSNQI